jgi:hypothetical protein
VSRVTRFDSLGLSWAEISALSGNVFYDKRQALLIVARFNAFVATQCAKEYAPRRGRPSLPLGQRFVRPNRLAASELQLSEVYRGTQFPQQGSLLGSQTDRPEGGLRRDFSAGCITQQPLALQAVQFPVKPTLAGAHRRVNGTPSFGRSTSRIARKREQPKIVGRV